MEAGQPAIENWVLELTDYLVKQLQIHNYRVISDRSAGVKSGIVITSNVDPRRNQQIFEYLNKNKVHISYRNGNLRIAPHFYNTEAEIDRLIGLLSDL